MSHYTLNYNNNRIGSLLFNTIDQPELFDPLSKDLNPNSNFLPREPTSRYMVEEDINPFTTSGHL